MATRINGNKSLMELLLAQHLREVNAPTPEREYKFCPGRLWRFDFAWPAFSVAVEVEGGTANHGTRDRDGRVRKSRHLTREGFENDCEKYNTATFMGWRVYRFTTQQVATGYARDFILRVLGFGHR